MPDLQLPAAESAGYPRSKRMQAKSDRRRHSQAEDARRVTSII